mgnify:CR=1 FL=1
MEGKQSFSERILNIPFFEWFFEKGLGMILFTLAWTGMTFYFLLSLFVLAGWFQCLW